MSVKDEIIKYKRLEGELLAIKKDPTLHAQWFDGRDKILTELDAKIIRCKIRRIELEMGVEL